MRITMLVVLTALLSGCTIATYSDDQGRELLVIDARLSGSAVGIEVYRPDGTKIRIMRDQGSPEGAIDAIGNAVQPLRITP